ncbi:UAA transporter [Punctularia strigosozonata HHB-11173 SS5]|uniref:UAA transporter n=1 Tax=Punctularia strigosozonata (strain HHB-11173) TaxID=741275 RepID=UPI0004417B93|nr:UAA transporter [Punctularia strigosozonata HHB-11173 SS5]EIN10201.1 UAA transporter [Punctularia strigosozonata HHB-11173 SS5]
MALLSWFTTLSLIFGGCCSNALTLEQLTSSFPRSGTLITFAQFLVVALSALPRQVELSRSSRSAIIPIPRLKRRQIPLTPYLIQVALFCLISLLNNAAFAYDVPMSVHIIFRSGGLVVSMVLGYLVLGRKYSTLQIFSIALVSAGVLLTTLSAYNPTPRASSSSDTSKALSSQYLIGISLLSLALLLSGLLGIVQERTYSRYSRSLTHNPWEESMFYLHALSLPMFLFLRHDIAAQLAAIRRGPTTVLALPHFPVRFDLRSDFGTGAGTTVAIPAGYIPLFLNTLTQLVCVSGVNQLTARVSSLTVTLVLAVRKAVSLLVSVLLFRSQSQTVDMGMMWSGATLVLLGTVLYSVATGTSKSRAQEKERKETDARAKGPVAFDESVEKKMKRD